MIIEISVATVAIACVVLIIYLILALRKLTELIQKANLTMQFIEKNSSSFAEESIELLRNSKEITHDLKEKLASLDAGFSSIRQTGEAANEIATSVKQASTAVSRVISSTILAVESKSNSAVTDVLQTIPLLINIWKKFKSK